MVDYPKAENAIPCPFCGSSNLLIAPNGAESHVHCDECGAAGPTATTQEQSVVCWNDRVDDDADDW